MFQTEPTKPHLIISVHSIGPYWLDADGSITLLTIKRRCNHQVEWFCGGLQPLPSSGAGLLCGFVAFLGYFCKVIIAFCLLMPWVRVRGAALRKWQNLPTGLKFMGESSCFLPIFSLNAPSLGQRWPNITFAHSTNPHRDFDLIWSHLHMCIRQ